MPPGSIAFAEGQKSSDPAPIRFLRAFAQVLESARFPELLAESGFWIGDKPFRHAKASCGFCRFNIWPVAHGLEHGKNPAGQLVLCDYARSMPVGIRAIIDRKLRSNTC